MIVSVRNRKNLVVDKVAWNFLGYLFLCKNQFTAFLKIVRSHIAKFCYICIKQQRGNTMKHKAYKLNFTFEKDHYEGGTLLTKVHTFTRTILAEDEGEAFLEAARIKGENSDVNCKFTGFEEVKTGKIWKVTMDGTAHLYNSEDKLVDREDMHKVMFVDALDMYDAEQVAYRIWERQIVEEGWNDIMIFRSLVGVPKHPMTDREVA